MGILSLRQIEVIRAVLRAGTMTSAARQLGVSQPGISRVLRHAEMRLGLTLFERRAGRVYPTPEVLALAPDIEKAYGEIDAIQRTASDLRNVRGGRLSLVSIPSIATTLLVNAIGRLVAESPNLRVTVRTAVMNHEVVESVRSGAAELGFAFDVQDHPGITATEIGQSRLVCVLPKGHRLAASASVNARDLHELPLVTFSGTLALGAALASSFAEAGATLRVGVEVSQSYVACALVNAGAGIAVVDDLFAGVSSGDLVIRPFHPQRMVRLYALSRSERLSLAAQALLKELVPKSLSRGDKPAAGSGQRKRATR